MADEMMGVAKRVAYIQAEDSPKWTTDDFLRKIWAQAVDLPLGEVELFQATAGILPQDIGAFAGVVIGGSRHNVTDGLAWMPGLFDFIRRCAEYPAVRVVAVCFGCQAVAAALDGEVGFNPTGKFRYTRERIRVDTATWDVLPKELSLMVAHGQQVTRRPPESTLVADSHGSPNELFFAGKHRNILCCQSHPEFDPEHCIDNISPALVKSGLLSAADARAADLAFQAGPLDSHILRSVLRMWLVEDHVVPRIPCDF
ncbi:hypothetical protein CTAYLR_005451 [Chrysophaeum taylorii]|uniref:Glutamine amidotransferase domain-containing protein n=1 Tax=Chrysophaeum taylorii TaxID=2483200 RepID=A0AAD7UJP5_9STRA|nr:hypothetical protein CTAYLR_005451 [Chrysophaeum taylorii]